MPPPHPNQGMRYPPGKEGGAQAQQYPGYPSPAQGPQQRVPPYGKIRMIAQAVCIYVCLINI